MCFGNFGLGGFRCTGSPGGFAGREERSGGRVASVAGVLGESCVCHTDRVEEMPGPSYGCGGLYRILAYRLVRRSNTTSEGRLGELADKTWNPVKKVVFAPDDEHLITESRRGLVHVWSLRGVLGGQ